MPDFKDVRLPYKLLQQQAQLLTNQINETGRGLDPNRNLIAAYAAARDCAGKLALFLEEVPEVVTCGRRIVVQEDPVGTSIMYCIKPQGHEGHCR